MASVPTIMQVLGYKRMDEAVATAHKAKMTTDAAAAAGKPKITTDPPGDTSFGTLAEFNAECQKLMMESARISKEQRSREQQRREKSGMYKCTVCNKGTLAKCLLCPRSAQLCKECCLGLGADFNWTKDYCSNGRDGCYD